MDEVSLNDKEVNLSSDDDVIIDENSGSKEIKLDYEKDNSLEIIVDDIVEEELTGGSKEINDDNSVENENDMITSIIESMAEDEERGGSKKLKLDHELDTSMGSLIVDMVEEEEQCESKNTKQDHDVETGMGSLIEAMAEEEEMCGSKKVKLDPDVETGLGSLIEAMAQEEEKCGSEKAKLDPDVETGLGSLIEAMAQEEEKCEPRKSELDHDVETGIGSLIEAMANEEEKCGPKKSKLDHDMKTGMGSLIEDMIEEEFKDGSTKLNHETCVGSKTGSVKRAPEFIDGESLSSNSDVELKLVQVNSNDQKKELKVMKPLDSESPSKLPDDSGQTVSVQKDCIEKAEHKKCIKEISEASDIQGSDNDVGTENISIIKPLDREELRGQLASGLRMLVDEFVKDVLPAYVNVEDHETKMNTEAKEMVDVKIEFNKKKGIETLKTVCKMLFSAMNKELLTEAQAKLQEHKERHKVVQEKFEEFQAMEREVKHYQEEHCKSVKFKQVETKNVGISANIQSKSSQSGSSLASIATAKEPKSSINLKAPSAKSPSTKIPVPDKSGKCEVIDLTDDEPASKARKVQSTSILANVPAKAMNHPVKVPSRFPTPTTSAPSVPMAPRSIVVTNPSIPSQAVQQLKQYRPRIGNATRGISILRPAVPSAATASRPVTYFVSNTNSGLSQPPVVSPLLLPGGRGVMYAIQSGSGTAALLPSQISLLPVTNPPSTTTSTVTTSSGRPAKIPPPNVVVTRNPSNSSMGNMVLTSSMKPPLIGLPSPGVPRNPTQRPILVSLPVPSSSGNAPRTYTMRQGPPFLPSSFMIPQSMIITRGPVPARVQVPAAALATAPTVRASTTAVRSPAAAVRAPTATGAGVPTAKLPHLPAPPRYAVNEKLKQAPPRPVLQGSREANSEIKLRWDMKLLDSHAAIAKYQLCTYSPNSGGVAKWKDLEKMDALPLPMQCTVKNINVSFCYFTIRAIDIHTRYGPFSEPICIPQ